MRPARRRLLGLVCLLGCAGVGVWFLARTLRSSLRYYTTPSELLARDSREGVRLGGQVVRGSVVRQGDLCSFRVTDGHAVVTVEAEEPLPVLFREGQGVVAEGVWHPPVFRSRRLLVRHDQSYRPPASSALRESRPEPDPAEPPTGPAA